MCDELSDYEWAAIKPMLPNKPRGVRRVNDRRVLNGIFWVLRSGAPWRDLPETYGPRTTCYNRFVRWRQAGVWDHIVDALAAAHDAAVQMIAGPGLASPRSTLGARIAGHQTLPRICGNTRSATNPSSDRWKNSAATGRRLGGVTT